MPKAIKTVLSRGYIKWAILLLAFIVLVIFVGLYFAFVVLLVGAAVFSDLDSWIAYMAALTLIVLAAMMAVLSYDSAAAWFASIAFYGMAIGVIVQVYGYVKGNEADDLTEGEGRD